LLVRHSRRINRPAVDRLTARHVRRGSRLQ
jgi:hypothetical protein